MSGIVGITPRVQELGRIRMGDKNDRDLPVSLSTFRLTSYDKTLLEAAAALYGGEVKPWEDAPDPNMWEVVTAASALDILIPRSLDPVSQYWEMWQGGACERRCDGRFEEVTKVECICGDLRGTGEEYCDVVTRLSVILPRVPGLGVWRLDTGGYNAAVSMPATVTLLLGMDGRAMVPAVLHAVQRSSKVRRPDGKVETHRFVVPILGVPGVTIAGLIDGNHPELEALPEAVEQPKRLTAEERVAERAAAIATPALGQAAAEEGEPAALGGVAPSPAQCQSYSPYEDSRQCQREEGHEGLHKNSAKESW